jgi:acetylornithine deacetylase/succinyl-diaminopimelate desuccinylase-like protein
MKKSIIFIALNLMCLNVFSQTEITKTELKDHILFLASEKNAGRYPGGIANRTVVKYLKKDFKKLGLIPFNNNYKQKFKVNLRVQMGGEEKPKVNTCNVVGYLEGNDPLLKQEYIILGAHYDHLGMGDPSSKSDKKNTIHYGADDNASGTAALLEIAEKVALNKQDLKRSIIFIAFGAEEQGLLGSKYFVENPLIDLSSIKFFLNFDLAGTGDDGIQVVNGSVYKPQFDSLSAINQRNDLVPQVKIRGAACNSDHCMFDQKEVPGFYIYTLGGIKAYHDIHDRPETLPLTEFEDYFKLITEFVGQL